jgi:hypothetical protein
MHHQYQQHRQQIATGINGTSGKFATSGQDTDGKYWEYYQNA